MKSFVEKTKLLILGFKISHLSMFFKEQRKEKPLKHTTHVLKAGPLHSQCLRKNQSRQHQKLVTPCSAFPPNLDRETHDGNLDTSRQTEGAWSLEKQRPGARAAGCHLDRFSCLHNWEGNQDTHLLSCRVPVVSQTLISEDKPVFLPLKGKGKSRLN